MDNTVNANKLSRLFPHASNAFKRLNSDNNNAAGGPNKSEQLARKQLEKSLDKKTMEECYKLTFVDMVFHADHGIELDEDNRRFIVKPLLDAIVSMGIAKSDKEIKTNVLQRLD